MQPGHPAADTTDMDNAINTHKRKRKLPRRLLASLLVAAAAGLLATGGAHALDPHKELKSKLATLGTATGFDPRTASYGEYGDAACLFACPSVTLGYHGPKMSEDAALAAVDQHLKQKGYTPAYAAETGNDQWQCVRREYDGERGVEVGQMCLRDFATPSHDMPLQVTVYLNDDHTTAQFMLKREHNAVQ